MADIKDPENTVIIELKDGPVDVTIVFPGAIATDIAGNSGVTVNAPADDTAADADGTDDGVQYQEIIDWVLAIIAFVVCIYPLLPFEIGDGGGGYSRNNSG